MELSDQVDAVVALSQGMDPGGWESSSAVLAPVEKRKVCLFTPAWKWILIHHSSDL